MTLIYHPFLKDDEMQNSAHEACTCFLDAKMECRCALEFSPHMRFHQCRIEIERAYKMRKRDIGSDAMPWFEQTERVMKCSYTLPMVTHTRSVSAIDGANQFQ